MIRQINFDMDGTLANLYGIENWLEYLLAKDETPYREAKPLINLSVLARMLNRLQKEGYRICIISWLARTTDANYDAKVTLAKINWLNKRMPSVKWDEINILPYGTPKYMFGSGILFDDEERNRVAWGEGAYDADNIIEILKGL